jgi:hypothetical protein
MKARNTDERRLKRGALKRKWLLSSFIFSLFATNLMSSGDNVGV